MTDRLIADRKKLARLFANRRIPTDKIAFYNEKNFRGQEQQDPSFLEFYAAWVRARERSPAYDNYVRRLVPQIVKLVSNELANDDKVGMCIDASMMLSKILELEGVWNYAARGALSVVSVTDMRATQFWMFDSGPVAGHTWIVAPPFEMIDVTLNKQIYAHGEANKLPPYLILETAVEFQPELKDCCDPAFWKDIGLGRQGDNFALACAQRAMNFFPSYEVKCSDLILRYISCGTSVSDAQSINDITNCTWNGRLAAELYEDVIRPALGEAFDGRQ